MPADAGDSGTRLVLPEGYAAEQTEGGRLHIYNSKTGAWVCEVDPSLVLAQEMVEGLIAAHESEVLRLQSDPYS